MYALGDRYFVSTFGGCSLPSPKRRLPHHVNPSACESRALRWPGDLFGGAAREPFQGKGVGAAHMSNSSVASFPANSIIARLPPGWSGRKELRSYTLSWMITQQSLSVLCSATAASVSLRVAAGGAVAAEACGGGGAVAACSGGGSDGWGGRAWEGASLHCMVMETPPCGEGTTSSLNGVKWWLMMPIRCSALTETDELSARSRYAAASAPQTRPNTTQSSRELPVLDGSSGGASLRERLRYQLLR
jgi:hypothetical protein